jgi:hypothetical protein
VDLVELKESSLDPHFDAQWQSVAERSTYENGWFHCKPHPGGVRLQTYLRSDGSYDLRQVPLF